MLLRSSYYNDCYYFNLSNLYYYIDKCIHEKKQYATNNLVLVKLIKKPINKESPIYDKLWDKGITIAQ